MGRNARARKLIKLNGRVPTKAKGRREPSIKLQRASKPFEIWSLEKLRDKVLRYDTSKN